MKRPDRALVDPAVRTRFVDGLDTDEVMRAERPNDHRWDYVLGDGESDQLVGIEPHPAESGEVSVVIAKKRATRAWLRDHLKTGVQVERWLWVTAGKQTFPAGGRTNLRLAQAGIQFAGRRIGAKHLK